MLRQDIHTTMMATAQLWSHRSTCIRRAVGCVISDDRNRILSVGYNGVPARQSHCHDTPCAGATAPSGQSLDLCLAIHAEINALLHCPDIDAARNCYVTAAPCVSCTKAMINTGIRHIYYAEDYPQRLNSEAQWCASDAARTFTALNLSGLAKNFWPAQP